MKRKMTTRTTSSTKDIPLSTGVGVPDPKAKARVKPCSRESRRFVTCSRWKVVLKMWVALGTETLLMEEGMPWIVMESRGGTESGWAGAWTTLEVRTMWEALEVTTKLISR